MKFSLRLNKRGHRNYHLLVTYSQVRISLYQRHVITSTPKVILETGYKLLKVRYDGKVWL